MVNANNNSRKLFSLSRGYIAGYNPNQACLILRRRSMLNIMNR
ncbi:MAG: hypothetical protein ACI9E4_000276 [Pseudohongiellaceae bacterium]|jgi:hypothetical protein